MPNKEIPERCPENDFIAWKGGGKLYLVGTNKGKFYSGKMVPYLACLLKEESEKPMSSVIADIEVIR